MNHLKSMFPAPDQADENGIVACSRGITCEMLMDSYYHGIFPWPFGEEYQVIPWCAPLMRGVLMLDEFHIPASFQREMKKNRFTCRIDSCFEEVIRSCAAAVRPEADGTWITQEVIRAYCQFHEMGYAHSFETFDAEGKLVGGLYGISCGRVFCGESMFYKVSGASKFAFVKMIETLKQHDVVLVDTQMVTNATRSFGAKEIPSAEYIKLLKQYRGKTVSFFAADPA